MTHYLRGLCDRSAGHATEAGSPIRFVASTEVKARDGLIIEARGWQLDNFNASPSILWAHDYAGNRPPIGRAERVWVDGDRLMADIVFDQEDEFALAVERKYRSNVLSSVSVGWNSLQMEGNRVTSAELLDISAVPIPGDPHALMERQARAFADLGSRLTTLVDEEKQTSTHDAEALWVGTAYQMVRLFRRDASDAESVRLPNYRRLCRSYERLGKTAPEFLGAAELAALDPDTWRGLFLEGEADAVPELFIVTTPAEPDDWWTQNV